MVLSALRSMTGYGKAECLAEGKKITVEIRSLNSKQMDLSVRMPSVYREQEFQIRNNVTKKLQRGKVDLFITVENIDNTAALPINAGAFKGYYSQLCNIAEDVGIGGGDRDINIIASILRLPDVIQADKVQIEEPEWEALHKTVDQAIEQMDRFRIQEGQILIHDLLKRVTLIEQLKNDVTPYEQERIEIVRKRIRENLENINTSVDENRFEQELIFYLEKLDITEEKVRLQNHCDYFREVARTEEAAGRKLGFIAQEMGREINTLGSKANQSQIQRLVVEMKNELEKIKEQVLNLL